MILFNHIIYLTGRYLLTYDLRRAFLYIFLLLFSFISPLVVQLITSSSKLLFFIVKLKYLLIFSVSKIWLFETVKKKNKFDFRIFYLTIRYFIGWNNCNLKNPYDLSIWGYLSCVFCGRGGRGGFETAKWLTQALESKEDRQRVEIISTIWW